MSHRIAALLTLALSLEVTCVVGRMSRLPDLRVANNPVEIVAVEKAKSRSVA